MTTFYCNGKTYTPTSSGYEKYHEDWLDTYHKCHGHTAILLAETEEPEPEFKIHGRPQFCSMSQERVNPDRCDIYQSHGKRGRKPTKPRTLAKGQKSQTTWFDEKMHAEMEEQAEEREELENIFIGMNE